jgi:low temperature requirement protein LtrA
MSSSSPITGHDLGGRPLVATMQARSAHEPHRVATPLELLFDLVFVVAIAQAASGLHHAIAEQHAVEGLLGYAMVFFAIWWAWMNFTWFASAYDCDDVLYRVAVFVQITGALIMAAGVPAFFAERDANVATIGGYAVMRLALVAQWLRAGAADPARRATAHRYALGIALLQIVWIVLVFMPRAVFLPSFVLLCVLEMAVPVWAERKRPTTWHRHHIAERYGLLTLIVLGESILAATTAVQAALSTGSAASALAPVILGGLLIVFAMWWAYFDRPVHDLLTSLPKAIFWGYGHYFIFASAAAVGAGLAVAVDDAAHHAKISAVAAGYAVAIPVAVYLLCLWVLHDRPEYRRTRAFGPIGAALVLLSPFTGQAVLATGLILAALIGVKLVVLRS